MKKLLIVTALLALAAAPGHAAEKTYHFGVSDQRTNVTFESTTDFEVVLGSTHELQGQVTADLERGTGTVNLAVPVASLGTGIDMRDEHLRSPMWLDAERHPTISFRSQEARKLADGTWQVAGTFTLHGVSRQVTARADVRPIPAELATKAGLEARPPDLPLVTV
jgi:polyisoprenoid-binding protein YceI